MADDPELKSSTDRVGIDLDKHYSTTLADFTDAVEEAITSSLRVFGLKAEPQEYWRSILFTRLCTTSVTILSLCPRSKLNQNEKLWDCSSVAALTRNLYECAVYFFYIGIEILSSDEWEARLKVMQLHDCMERFRMFQVFDPSDPQLAGFEAQADQLRGVLASNAYFTQLPEKLKRDLLRGKRASILTRDEILTRMGQFDPKANGFYRFRSSHVHSFPLAFYRMEENNVGLGVVSDSEKGNTAASTEFCTGILRVSTEEYKKAFAGKASFSGVRVDLSGLK